MSDSLGWGDRLHAGPAPELAHTAFADELRAARFLWGPMSHADLAHAIALHEAGVLDRSTARELMLALLDLDRRTAEEADLDPFVGDIYNNRDRALRRLAPDVAGALHAGRARREATTIAWQIACRERLLDLGAALSDFIDVFADVAAAHRRTLMPDFTYLHRAHPTSLGHYLLTHAWPMERHLSRLARTIDSVNRSPAGSGSVNGTRIPLDRGRLADLLGFDGLLLHTRDAMWAPDLVIDQLALATNVMTTIDRLAEELQLWTTEAFAFMEPADEHSRTSVIMPHKKNPYALTHLRGAARRTLGLFVGSTASLMTPTGQPDNRTVAYHDVPAALDIATESARLATAVTASATFDTDALAAATDEGFLTSTELCDHLTLSRGLDNRSAHQIVGRAVRLAIDDRRRSLSAIDLERSAEEHGRDLELDPAELEAVLSPTGTVAGRATPGGAGPDAVASMCAELRAVASRHRGHLDDHPGHEYARPLLAAAEAIARHEPGELPTDGPQGGDRP